MNKEELSGKTFIMVGAGKVGKSDLIDRIKEKNPEITIISGEEAEQLGLHTICPETTIPVLKIPELKQTYFTPPETRADRRKKKRRK